MGNIVLLDLMGGVALLLWGLHMVRSGIMRAFGSELRRILGTTLRNRFFALLAGIDVTALLQSSRLKDREVERARDAPWELLPPPRSA
jgi:phosphate:Na+ symporter